ncbi:MAG: isocitrate/isopropylmalate family dehydrogenase [Candidatus Diapherotrites archaeon]
MKALAPMGIVRGEGSGPEIMRAAEQVLGFFEQRDSFQVPRVEFKSQAPALKYSVSSFNQLKRFYAQMRARNGCVLRGAIYARQVYKLRHDFRLTFKPILLNPFPELFDDSPLKREVVEKMDLLLVRENAQGLLMAKEKIRNTLKGKKFEGVFNYDEKLNEAFVRFCFLAAQHRKKKIMFLIKGDVWGKLNGMWFNTWKKVNKEFPEVEWEWEHDDTWFGYFLKNPEKYDVVAALGISGDLIADPLATLLYGTRALTPSANIAPDGFMSFQTVHGAGTQIPKGKASPLAMMRALGMAFEYFYQKPEYAKEIDSAIRRVLAQGYRGADLFDDSKEGQKIVDCAEMTALILKELETL